MMHAVSCSSQHCHARQAWCHGLSTGGRSRGGMLPSCSPVRCAMVHACCIASRKTCAQASSCRRAVQDVWRYVAGSLGVKVGGLGACDISCCAVHRAHLVQTVCMRGLHMWERHTCHMQLCSQGWVLTWPGWGFWVAVGVNPNPGAPRPAVGVTPKSCITQHSPAVHTMAVS
jgi:hypothetical protein